jgi:N-acyl-L-homoserine lactone synthetase
MDAIALSDEISLAASQFTLEEATTAAHLRDVFQLRHQVYCVERGFEAAQGGEETDEFDVRSRHMLLRHASDGDVVGTVRVLAPNPANLNDSFPMQRVCHEAWLRPLPLRTTGEVSRFAISKKRRMSCTTASLLRLSLLRGVVQLSSEMGLTHWLAVMEPSLVRLNQRNGIHFQPVGPLVSYHGLRQPTVGNIAVVLARMEREQPQVWNYLTRHGTWFGVPATATTPVNDGRIFDDERTSRIGTGWLAGERLAGAPARDTGDVALKLRMLAHESERTSSPFSKRLLMSAIADLDRMGAARV